MNKEITLIRVKENGKTSFGILMTEDYPICLTIENKWLNNRPFLSCIPTGVYKAERYYSRKFQTETFIVHVGQGRSGIIFHPGNTHLDTHGCILPVEKYSLQYGRKGEQFPIPLQGGSLSQFALEKFKKELTGVDEFNLRVTTA